MASEMTGAVLKVTNHRRKSKSRCDELYVQICYQLPEAPPPPKLPPPPEKLPPDEDHDEPEDDPLPDIDIANALLVILLLSAFPFTLFPAQILKIMNPTA